MTGTLTHTIEQAAERLGGPFTVDWLKARVKAREIPFLKLGRGTGRGGRIGFSEAHLEAIVAMFAVDPPEGSQPGDFTPLTRRRSA